ncbi:hypothetical protein HAX54_036899, partial [Datura stramonium]|nr:hypothetical protein [Datura stramonium]
SGAGGDGGADGSSLWRHGFDGENDNRQTYDGPSCVASRLDVRVMARHSSDGPSHTVMSWPQCLQMMEDPMNHRESESQSRLP